MRSGVGRRGSVVVRYEVAEVAVLFFADRSLERNGLLRYSHDLAHLIDGHIELFGDLVGRGLVAVLVEELRRYLLDLIDGLDHVDGYTYGTRLIGDSSGDGLSDPPCGVGRELEALGIIELLNGLDEAEVALLDEVEEVHTASEIALRNTYDQSEVRFGKALFGADIALVDTDGEVDLLLGSQQRYAADLFEVYLDGVVDRDRVALLVVVGNVGAFGDVSPFAGQVESFERKVFFDIRFDYLYAGLFKTVIEFFELFGIDVHLADGVEYLLAGDIAFGFTHFGKLFYEIPFICYSGHKHLPFIYLAYFFLSLRCLR